MAEAYVGVDIGPYSAFLFAVALVAFGLVKIYDATRKYLLRQKIMNTPTSKVESAAVGLVELFGKASFPEPMQSPISRTDCAYWKILAYCYASEKYANGWKIIYEKESTKPFYLADGTGKILVDPKEAQIDISQDAFYEGYLSGKGKWGISHKKMDQKVLSFIDDLPESEKFNFTVYGNQQMQISEYFIANGDPLYVLGSAAPLEGASSSVGYENLMVKKGKYDRTMYITDSEEKKALWKMSWGSMAMDIIIGLGISLAGIAILFLVFKIW